MVMDFQTLASWVVQIDHTVLGRLLADMAVQSSLVGQTKACQYEDPHLARLRDQAQKGGVKAFTMDSEGVLRRHGKLCIPTMGDVKLVEAHIHCIFSPETPHSPTHSPRTKRCI